MHLKLLSVYLSLTQRTQYPLIKEYALDYRGLNIIDIRI